MHIIYTYVLIRYVMYQARSQGGFDGSLTITQQGKNVNTAKAHHCFCLVKGTVLTVSYRIGEINPGV